MEGVSNPGAQNGFTGAHRQVGPSHTTYLRNEGMGWRFREHGRSRKGSHSGGEVLRIREEMRADIFICISFIDASCLLLCFNSFSFFTPFSLLFTGCAIVGKFHYLVRKLQRNGHKREVLDSEVAGWIW